MLTCSAFLPPPPRPAPQVQCAMLINSDLPGLPSQFQTTGRPTRGFVQR